MKLMSYRIGPKDFEFRIEAESDAEIALLKFIEYQAPTVNPDENWDGAVLIAGRICQ